MASLPAPIRAGLGLLATALDTVQELVEHAPEIPMEAVGNSMQLSMRLQQHYVALLTRGDEFIASLRGAPEEPPAWATFDDLAPTASTSADPADADLPGDGPGGDDRAAGDDSGRAVFDEDSDRAVFDDDDADVPAAELQDEPRQAGQGDPLLDAVTSALEATASAGIARTKAPAKKVGVKKVPGQKVPAKKVPAKKVAAKKAPATQPSAGGISAAAAGEPPAVKKAAAKKSPAKKAPAKKAVTAAGRAPDRDPGPALASAAPILTPSPAAKKTAPRKAAARKSPTKTAAGQATGAPGSAPGDLDLAPAPTEPFTVPPRLDAALDNGDASARPRSAFDLVEPPIEESPLDSAVLDSAGSDATAVDAPGSDAIAADSPAGSPAPGSAAGA